MGLGSDLAQTTYSLSLPPAAPTLEVFFARQPPGTGIKSHTDFVNFIQTTHLGLQVPEGDCWIKVGKGGSGEAQQPWAGPVPAQRLPQPGSLCLECRAAELNAAAPSRQQVCPL